MPNRYQAVSGLIEIADEWLLPNRYVLRAPVRFKEPSIAQSVLHETVHYWQHISSGFLALLAEEEWNRLIAFESEGELRKPGPIRHRFVEEAGEYNLSAQDFHESAARYWEFMIQGNGIDDGIAFEEEMKKQGGAYAIFFTKSRAIYGDHAPIFFPMISHLALQTDHPAYYFDLFMEAVLNRFELGHEPIILEDLWQNHYTYIRTICIRRLQEEGVPSLLMAGQVIKDGSLRENVIYDWSFHRMNVTAEVAIGTDEFYSLKEKYPPEAPDFLIGLMVIDKALASPGSPLERSLLIEWLSPPCVLFSN